MARKKVRAKAGKVAGRKSGWWGTYKIYIIPSFIGALVAWFFAGSFVLGISVFIAVWIGEWIAFSYLNSK